MSRTTLALTLVALCASASLVAQQAPPAVSSGQRGTAPTLPAATPSPQAPRPVDAGIDPSDANITIELTVVDKPAGSMTTSTRRGTITVANQSSGSVRGLSGFYNSNRESRLDPLGLDVDARTTLRKSGMVSASLTVAYVPAGAEPAMNSVQRQSATLFLKPGQETQVLTTGSMSDQGPAVRITAKATVNR